MYVHMQARWYGVLAVPRREEAGKGETSNQQARSGLAPQIPAAHRPQNVRLHALDCGMKAPTDAVCTAMT